MSSLAFVFYFILLRLQKISQVCGQVCGPAGRGLDSTAGVTERIRRVLFYSRHTYI